MAADLLFGGVALRKPRSFNLREGLLDGLTEQEVISTGSVQNRLNLFPT